MAILVKEIPIKAYNSIGKIERYYILLRQAFNIIKSKSSNTITIDNALQLAVKAVNDTTGLNGLVLILLVFGAYSRMTETLPPSPVIYERAETIRKAMRKIKKIYI